MKAKIKKLWIEALTSGKYKQTRAVLKDDNGYCCLGVLCDIYAKTQKKKGFVKTYNKFYFGGSNSSFPTALPPSHVCKWAGLETETGIFMLYGEESSLVEANDDAVISFKEIAKIIEKHF